MNLLIDHVDHSLAIKNFVGVQRHAHQSADIGVARLVMQVTCKHNYYVYHVLIVCNKFVQFVLDFNVGLLLLTGHPGNH